MRALTGVTLELFPGEAHALLGENGAGKSTLIKMLAGVHRPDAGQVLVDGEPQRFSGPADALAAGIAIIYQEPTLFGDLTVAENIFMRRQPLGAGRRIDVRAMHRRTEELFDRLGVRLDPARPASGLSIADQQLVEIAKALSFDARVIVMDEPTAALSAPEVRRLFGVVEALLAQDAAVLFVSHRLDEVFALCRRATVLRDGAYVWSGELADETPDALVRRMVGRELSAALPQAGHRNRRRAAAGAAADPGRRVHRRVVRGAGGGDRRAGGPGRRGPQRGGAGGVRHRPAGRGRGARARQAVAARFAHRGDGGRHRRSCRRTAASRDW